MGFIHEPRSESAFCESSPRRHEGPRELLLLPGGHTIAITSTSGQREARAVTQVAGRRFNCTAPAPPPTQSSRVASLPARTCASKHAHGAVALCGATLGRRHLGDEAAAERRESRNRVQEWTASKRARDGFLNHFSPLELGHLLLVRVHLGGP